MSFLAPKKTLGSLAPMPWKVRFCALLSDMRCIGFHARGTTLFSPRTLAVFTKTAWWVIPAFWLPIIAALVWPFVRDVGVVSALMLMCLGIFLWTLVEYAVHRFLFHVDEVLPNVPPLLLVHFLLHGIHHKVPMDRYRLVMPPALSVVLGLGLYASIGLIVSPFKVPLVAFNAGFGGGLLGYVLYDLIHYSEHHTVFAKVWCVGGSKGLIVVPLPSLLLLQGSYLAGMKTYHMKHHYAGLHHAGYGITTKLWDWVFGTVLVLPGSGSSTDKGL